MLKKAAEEAEASIEKERHATKAAEARGAEDANRAASETEALREQLDNAVRSNEKGVDGGVYFPHFGSFREVGEGDRQLDMSNLSHAW